MKCPHCLTSFHEEVHPTLLGEDCTSQWVLRVCTCPDCQRFVISLHERYARYTTGGYAKDREFFCYPKAPSRAPLPSEVPSPYAEDYAEACLTLADSPKASAALSRRCLQQILRDKAGVKPGNLADEIHQVIDSGKVPSHISESLDAIRNIGNFAAHPIKSKASGEIIDVEPGEAEWNSDVLETLFDFYFVQPELLKKKRAALDAKLSAAGKPKMK